MYTVGTLHEGTDGESASTAVLVSQRGSREPSTCYLLLVHAVIDCAEMNDSF